MQQRPEDRADGPKGMIRSGTRRDAWHHGAVSGQEERYDRIAEGYASWWSPIHRPATLRLLDAVASIVEVGATHLLDIGSGTGAMAASAVARWPAVALDGVDISSGMIAIAERERATLATSAAARLRFHHAPADRLPFPDATFDLALSAFVLQLVPSRYRALREARRVLAPGGRIAYVTWLAGGAPFAGDDAYDAALAAVGLEPREYGGGHDVESPEAAAAGLRRAGFTEIRSWPDRLEHRFTPEGYLGFVAQFDDEDQFASLDAATRTRLERELLARLRDLPPEGLRLEYPIVYVTGRRT